MPRSLAVAARPHGDHLGLEARIAQPLGEPLIRRRRPDRENATGPQGRPLAQFSLPAYLKQRFTRLARPYYVVLLLSALPVLAAAYVKTGLIPAQSWWDLLAHVFFVHNLNLDYASSFNMALWTMALQVQFYLLFPLFLLLRFRQFEERFLLLFFFSNAFQKESHQLQPLEFTELQDFYFQCI